MLPTAWFVTVLLAWSFLSPSALADEVKLKSGQVVKGLIVVDDGKIVKIKTAEGKTMSFKRDDIESVAESPEIGNDEIDSKLKAIDGEDATALADTAKWAKDGGQKGWRLVAELALKRDKNNDIAHELLDHEKIGEVWYDDRNKAEKARKDAKAKEYQEKGFIAYKGGWIKKEDKPLADKNPGGFDKDSNGLWRDKAEIKREQGFELVNGKWVKTGTPEDREAVKKFKDVMKDDIWVTTTPHFRLHMQTFSPEKVDEFGVLAEKVYDWFVKEMRKDSTYQVFRGNRAVIVFLKDKATCLEWFKNYRNDYSLDDSFEKLINMGGGSVVSGGRLFATMVNEPNDDIRNNLVHNVGHFMIQSFSRGLQGTPAWLMEAFAHQAEHVHLGNGTVLCSTLAKYGGDGGKAVKKFTTKDAHDRAKGLEREGRAEGGASGDEPFENLNKLELNSLSGDHLTKGWTLVEWLLKERHDQFVTWLEGMNVAEPAEALTKAIDGWAQETLDAEWRKYVKKNF